MRRSRPRSDCLRPPQTPLHRIVSAHLETWLTSRDRADQPVPGRVEEEFRVYLRFGILYFGFARARCTACDHGFLIGFSCKGRGNWIGAGRKRKPSAPDAQGVIHLSPDELPAIDIHAL